MLRQGITVALVREKEGKRDWGHPHHGAQLQWRLNVDGTRRRGRSTAAALSRVCSAALRQSREAGSGARARLSKGKKGSGAAVTDRKVKRKGRGKARE